MTRTHPRHLRDTERETQARGHLAPTCPEDARPAAPCHVGTSHPARREQDVRPAALRWASRALLVLAAVLMPVDGTKFGLAMPFWTPLAPWPLMLYVVLNCRELPGVVRRYRGYFLLPALFVALSAIGWATVALYPVPAALSILGVMGALGCLAAIDIASRVEGRRFVRALIVVLVCAYWTAFAVGVAQFASIHLDIKPMRAFLTNLMQREYLSDASAWGGGRPQFLFAEPSYIGMHLFGVLLPLRWLTHQDDPKLSRHLSVLVCVFAAGSLLMGVGVRIIIDTFIALAIDIAVHTDPRRRASVVRAVRRSVALVAGTVVVALANQRILSIMERGMLVGDGSLSARIAQGLTPIIAGVLQPLRLLVGFGAGNSIVAYQTGLDTAKSALSGLGKPSMWSWISKFTPESSFTMSAYTSVITDFGLVGLAVLVALVARDARHARTACLATGQRAEARTYLWWTILVAYLYLQFEGYAFYALPLLIWALRTRPLRVAEPV